MRYSLHACVLCLACSICMAGQQTDIYYTTEHISGARWTYNYTVSNLGLTEGIEEFTIWFDLGKYDQLEIASDSGLTEEWDQVVWQPNPILMSNGGFDALAKNTPLNVGPPISGFAVTFDWLGVNDPAEQFYEIINPDTFEVIDSGFTVPEPASLFMFGLAGLYGFIRKR